MIKNRKIKVALVHDFLTQYGGAERVLEELCKMYDEAPIYTLLWNKEKMGNKFAGRDVRVSYLQKFPRFLRHRLGWILPFLPVAPETFDLREFDLVISSSGAWSKGIITRLNTPHIAYIHSPMRFVWDRNEKYMREERKEKLAFFLRPIFSYLRLWDRLAADRPDYMIANSQYTRSRIWKYYRRDSRVIYPPVNQTTRSLEHGAQDKKQTNLKSELKTSNGNFQKPDTGYFLIVSRLSAYKKIDAAVEAFNRLELPLVIVGEGKERKRLEKMARQNIKFTGWISEEKLDHIYSQARAFIFPGVDDFGIAPVEAMSRGVPVIALKKGGVREIVEEGKTGIFFEASTPEIISDGVRRFCERESDFDNAYIQKSARNFSPENFRESFGEIVKEALQNKK